MRDRIVAADSGLADVVSMARSSHAQVTDGSTRHLALNYDVAKRLDEVARLLEERGANAFRARAYRNAARGLSNAPPGRVAAASTV